MTDQDKIPRFANGDPIGPLPKARRPWLHIIEIFLAWAVVVAVIFGMFYFLSLLLVERRAHADEAPAAIYEKPGECLVDADLRVTGDKRAACVERLETAARLARGEMRVNEGRKR